LSPRRQLLHRGIHEGFLTFKTRKKTCRFSARVRRSIPGSARFRADISPRRKNAAAVHI
jgi:hypothetical protein